MKYGIFLLLITLLVKCESIGLQVVSDDELMQFIKTKEFLLVVFHKAKCRTCVLLEKTVLNINDELQGELKCTTVSAHNSQLVRLYSPTKEPALVYFRHGIAVLYSGEPNADEIYRFVEENKSPNVKELSDESFEHITQAATGATTGDWFVMFYSPSCIECQRLQAVWEGVGAVLKGRCNIARVDSGGGAGIKTGKRFRVTSYPTFIFFRQGKSYRYELPNRDIKSLVAFAQDWYRNVKAEPVALLQSPFDELVDWSIEKIRYFVEIGTKTLDEHPFLLQVLLFGAFGFFLVLLTAIIAIYKGRKQRATAETKEGKKKLK